MIAVSKRRLFCVSFRSFQFFSFLSITRRTAAGLQTWKKNSLLGWTLAHTHPVFPLLFVAVWRLVIFACLCLKVPLDLYAWIYTKWCRKIVEVSVAKWEINKIISMYIFVLHFAKPDFAFHTCELCAMNITWVNHETQKGSCFISHLSTFLVKNERMKRGCSYHTPQLKFLFWVFIVRAPS